MLIGIIFGVPVGAIGVLTIKRTITYGALAGLASGMGCSTADMLYACVSVFGISLFSDFLLKYQSVISLIGGGVVSAMGAGIIIKRQTAMHETVRASKLLSFFATSFIIALANPATILTFVLAFAMFSVGEVSNLLQGMGLVSGIVMGTCMWWVLVTTGIGALKGRITEKALRVINCSLGCFILLFGMTVVIRTLF